MELFYHLYVLVGETESIYFIPVSVRVRLCVYVCVCDPSHTAVSAAVAG